MGWTNSGIRASFYPRGDFILGEKYKVMDVVYDADTRTSYFAKSDNVNVPILDSIIWQKICESIIGDKGEKGENGVYTLVHSRTGTVHILKGKLPTSDFVTVRFKAVQNFTENDIFRIGTSDGNYEVFIAKPVGREIKLPDKAFITDDIVRCELDMVAKKINFKLAV